MTIFLYVNDEVWYRMLLVFTPSLSPSNDIDSALSSHYQRQQKDRNDTIQCPWKMLPHRALCLGDNRSLRPTHSEDHQRSRDPGQRLKADTGEPRATFHLKRRLWLAKYAEMHCASLSPLEGRGGGGGGINCDVLLVL